MSTTHASASYSHETRASAAAIWAEFSAVQSWKEWNAGVHSCTLDSAFVEGAWMTMVLPDHSSIRSQLIDVVEPKGFTDETTLGDITVRVRHEICPLPDSGHRIVYAIEVTGIGAQEVCDQVSADFPDVLRALVARLESQ